MLYSKPKWSVQFPKLQTQLLTTELVPQHMWVWRLPLPTNPILYPRPMSVCFSQNFFFSQKCFFTENSSSPVGAVLYERISVFIPHKDPLQEDKWVIRIYDTNWLLWKWPENGQSVLPVNSPKDIISSRHASEEETWHQASKSKCTRGTTHACALPAAARERRQDARVLRPTLFC